MNNQANYRIKKSVVLREESDEWALLFDADTAAIVGMNPTGVAAWKLIELGKTEPEIVDELFSVFEQDKSVIAADIRKFIEDLLRQGFIEPSGG